MAETAHNDLNPDIVIGQADHRQLNELAMAGLDRTPELADSLLVELERASVVEDSTLPGNTVRMGSRVLYRTDKGEETAVTVVYPVEADIAQGKISIMTPVGTALIGLRAGQSITWRSRDNRRHMLTVVSVEPAAETVAE
jgi:regulator of nucleoside diphosphate kinase